MPHSTSTPVRYAGAPRPLGHYEQARVHAGLIHVSTQLPLAAPAPGSDAPPRITPNASAGAQAERALRNLVSLLEAGGSSVAGLIRLTAYLTDVDDWDAVDQACRRILGEHKPARGMLVLAALHGGWRVAFDAIGAVGSCTEATR